MEPGSGPRTLPHNNEAERSVLGGILVNKNGLFKALEVHLSPGDFYREAHTKIFQAMMDLENKSEPIDPLTIADLLRDRNELEKVGGSQLLNQLAAEEFTAAHVGKYAKIVREKSVLRNMINACTEIIGKATDGVEDIPKFLDEAQSAMFQIASVSEKGDFQPINTVLKEAFTKIETLFQTDADVSGLPTGFKDVDKLLSGLQPGALYIVAARPAMGKTSFVMNICSNIAIHQKKPVAIFSLEMAAVELVNRLLSSEAWIEASKVKTGNISDQDWRKLQQAANTFIKTKMFIDDTSDLTILEMRSKARRLKSKHGLSLLVVDYLQLMSGGASKSHESRERIISDISRGLKGLAKELEIPIIALSQLNRGVENRQDRRPNLADIRESGAIEQDADVVAFIYRDHVYNKESNPHDSELIIAKHRAGRTDEIPLTWMGEYTTFKDAAHDDDPGNYGGEPPPGFNQGPSSGSRGSGGSGGSRGGQGGGRGGRGDHYPEDPPFS